MPAPYMVDRFNALADRGNLEFEAWFNERAASDRSWIVDEETWRFRYRYLPSFRIGKRRVTVPFTLLRRRLPDVIASLYAEPSFVIGWFLSRARGRLTVFRLLWTSESWIKRRRWKEALKRFMLPRADGIETPGSQAREYARKYGVRDDRAFHARHTVDVDHFVRGRENALASRGDFRASLGLKGITFIYVGRLWWGKGVNYLIDGFTEAQRQLGQSEITLLLLGDGPDEELLREQCRRNKTRNVVFAGFIQKTELPRFFAAADVFVFPTLGDPYGLVVDEAMASSLPVISTSEAGEIRDRVEEGINGSIVPAADPSALAAEIERMARDRDDLPRMGAASLEKIRGNTPTGWAEDFEKAVLRIVSTGRGSRATARR